MLNIKHISIIVFSIAVLSCKNSQTTSDTDYNYRANELIGQIILKDSCDCVLEFGTESIVDYYKMNQPGFNFLNSLQKRLKIKNSKTLDSMVDLSNNFKLDSAILRQNTNNVKVISRSQLIKFNNDTTLEVHKICPRSIRIFQKPVFNEDFNIAVMHHGYPFGCDGGLTFTYFYKNNKWIPEY